MGIRAERQIRNIFIAGGALLLCAVVAVPAIARESLSSLRADVSQNAADIDTTQSEVSSHTSDIELNSDAICELAIAVGVCEDIVFCECPIIPKTVFVTSTIHNGDLGGLTGADAQCQSLADNAGLSGTYLAWLSDDTDSPSTRFAQSTGPYARVDGVVIANDWADLTDGALQAPIRVDQNGNTVFPMPPVVVPLAAWTGTFATGLPVDAMGPGPTCENWTMSAGAPHFFGIGQVGNTQSTSTAWSDATSLRCSDRGRLYCFEQ